MRSNPCVIGVTPTSFYFTVTLQDFSPTFSFPEVTFVTESPTANPLARNAVVDRAQI